MAKGLFLALPIKLKRWQCYLTTPESNIGKAHGKLHHVSRSMLEQSWDSQAQDRNPFAEPTGE
jgi:hypothetical protein